MENFIMPQGIFMKVSGRMVRQMGKEFIILKLELFIKVEIVLIIIKKRTLGE